ncbi:MAG: ABC transporter substrate-binding protein, partial [Actinomycetes bacterium]
MGSNQRRVFASAIALATAVGLTACGSSDGSGGGSDSGKIELSIGTFTEFGYEDLLKEYEGLHANIHITHHKTGQGGPYHQQLLTKLAAGEGLEDVVAIEEAHIPDVIDKPQLFNNLAEIGPKDATPERWLDWKYQQAVAKDGTWIGYGTDIGPEAICYRADLFKKAGLPTDREEVAELLGGDDATWDDYFAAGKKFVAKSDSAWFDGAVPTYQGMVNQLEGAYEDPETGEPKDLATNQDIKDLYDQVLAASVDDKLSAGLEQWGEDWTAGFQNNAWATMLCPPWMTASIEQNAGGVEGWDVADVFPGGGGNWGGSFLAVPPQSEHQEEAKQLAAYLTNAESEVAVFEA